MSNRRGFITTVISAFAGLFVAKPKTPMMRFIGPRFYGKIDIPREQRNIDVLRQENAVTPNEYRRFSGLEARGA